MMKTQGFNQAIIGVDPGASGGIAVWRSPGEFQLYPMPSTADKILNIFAAAQPKYIYLEKISGFVTGSRTPSYQVFNMGINYGRILAACEMTTAELIEVHPAKWQGVVAPDVKGITYAERKKYLNALAKKLYQEDRKDPVAGVTLRTCDALLVLRYGMIEQKEEK